METAEIDEAIPKVREVFEAEKTVSRKKKFETTSSPRNHRQQSHQANVQK